MRGKIGTSYFILETCRSKAECENQYVLPSPNFPHGISENPALGRNGT